MVSGSMAMPAHNGVRAKSKPCRGSQIPCSQMMSMNMRPPRPTAARKLASTPAVKARIRNSGRRNMGSATRVSMTAKAMSNPTPAPSSHSTAGAVQPMVWLPCGSMP